MVATRLHESLDLVESLKVPVFDIVRARGIWLMSQPMQWSVYGFSLVEGDARGILLNSNHPEPMQRFTCAHELGHLELGHQATLDHASDVDNSLGGSDQETQAQAFASSFIMPVRNVYRAMQFLRINEDLVTAVDAYLLSRALDVSFAAMCWRLVELEAIDRTTALDWVRRGPRAARRLMLDVPRGKDYTLITPEMLAEEVTAREGDLLVVDFEDRSDAGYVWRLEGEQAPRSILDWDGDRELAIREDAGGLPTIRPAGPVLQLTDEGPADIGIELTRPWQAGSTAAQVNLHVTVKPEHEFAALHQSQRSLPRGLR